MKIFKSESLIVGEGDKYINRKSTEYVRAVDIAHRYFFQLDYAVTHGHIWKKPPSKRIAALANLYCENKEKEIDLAIIISFPKKRQQGTHTLIKRLEKLKTFTEFYGLILCFSKGSGVFPMVTKRIWSQLPQTRIFSMDMKKEKDQSPMRELAKMG